MTEPRVLTQPLGGAALARAALNGVVPPSWYGAPPESPEAWRRHAEEVRAAFRGGEWARALGPALAASGPAADRLSRVAAGEGVVVTTGQQPGLFGGPIYTWSKALSALALADAHERATGVPTAPVFWAATYDADWMEASATYVAIGERVQCLRASPPVAGGHSMRDTPLGDVSPLLATLADAAGATADPDILALVAEAYEATQTVGGAFVRLLRGILEPLGIAVLDAGHPAVRVAQRPLMLRALRESAAIDAALRERDAEIRGRGYDPRVHHVAGLTVVFEQAGDDGVRRRVPIDRAGAATIASTELEPNVLLRPVAERFLLPTVAYMAGPGEIDYFAQASAVADALEVPVPPALPRWSGLIIEPHVQRILDRYGLRAEELRAPHAVQARLARERMPRDVDDAIAAYRAALEEAHARLVAALGREDAPLLPDAVPIGARNAIGHRLDRLERRALAAAKRRAERVMRDVATAHASLFPLGKPQERVLNLVPMLARHGRPLLGLVRERAAEHARALLSPTPVDAGIAGSHGHAGTHH